jgi:hypothetical protein
MKWHFQYWVCHKILVRETRGWREQMHELCFRNSLFTVTEAMLYNATVLCPQVDHHHHPSWCPLHPTVFLTLSNSTRTMVLSSILNERASSIGSAADIFGRRPVRMSAWTQVTLIFPVSPGKCRDGTSNQATPPQFQTQSPYHWTLPSLSY